MKKLKTFEVWHTNKYGFAMHTQKAVDLRGCYNRCPAKIQQTFYAIVDTETGDETTKEKLFERIYEQS